MVQDCSDECVELFRLLKPLGHRSPLIHASRLFPDAYAGSSGAVPPFAQLRRWWKTTTTIRPRVFLCVWAVRTGMRLGELRELRVGDIDLRGARIRVKRQRTQRGQVKAPKGDKARTVQVPADAVAVLRRRVSGLDRDDLVFSKPAGYVAGNRNGEPAKGGEPWSHKDIIGAVKRGAAAAKLEGSLGVHTLRHTFATHA
jgi:integrase